MIHKDLLSIIEAKPAIPLAYSFKQCQSHEIMKRWQVRLINTQAQLATGSDPPLRLKVTEALP